MKLRAVVVMALISSGCLAPIQFDTLMARAQQNELAASQFAQGRRVFFSGTVEDITALRTTEIVGWETTQHTLRAANTTRRRSSAEPIVREDESPYARLTTNNGTTVYCFMPMSTAITLVKGERRALNGFFDTFVHGAVSLYDCRID